MLARMTALSLVLQGLLERMFLSGRLGLRDFDGIKRFALGITTDLKAHSATGPQVAAERIEDEVHAFFESMTYLGDEDHGEG
jgi:hypothetical protein